MVSEVVKIAHRGDDIKQINPYSETLISGHNLETKGDKIIEMNKRKYNEVLTGAFIKGEIGMLIEFVIYTS